MLEFTPTGIDGVLLVAAQPAEDERGFFARIFDAKTFGEAGLCANWVQASRSFNRTAGTLRGMHFQTAPFGEIKLIRCTRGAIFDVAVDLREDSATIRNSYGTELTAENGRALYIPKGVAHGFVTLSDDAEVEYLISEYHHPEAATGVRWDDPALAITWPRAPSILNQRDREWPLLGGQ
jgi:dTDP-4-dehydrorhamnose 3,5-epimerase